MRQQFKQSKPKPIHQSCNIKFPDRVWEPTENGWVTRTATADDYARRRDVALSLGAVLLS